MLGSPKMHKAVLVKLPLPVILDDVFVNFDASRARAAAVVGRCAGQRAWWLLTAAVSAPVCVCVVWWGTQARGWPEHF